MTEVRLVFPAGYDDPARPSGGNVYDRRIRSGLAGAGWTVPVHTLPGPWPRPGVRDGARLARLLGLLPEGTVVLVDGLIASAAPDVLAAEAGRVRLVVLVHLPLGEPVPGRYDAAAAAREGRALAAASCVISTSWWTRTRLLHHYGLPPDRVLVAPPGVDRADLVAGRAGGQRLLCVGAVTALKGHDVLVGALAGLAGLPWHCACVGSLDVEPDFVARVRSQLGVAGLAARVRLVGVRGGPDLDDAYAGADLLVSASRAETFGMAVTEALARGLPVVAAEVGGLPEALGRAGDGSRPGLLVPPGDPAALARAIRRWLGDADLRGRLRASARERRDTLAGWTTTTRRVAEALTLAGARDPKPAPDLAASLNESGSGCV